MKAIQKTNKGGTGFFTFLFVLFIQKDFETLYDAGKTASRLLMLWLVLAFASAFVIEQYASQISTLIGFGQYVVYFPLAGIFSFDVLSRLVPAFKKIVLCEKETKPGPLSGQAYEDNLRVRAKIIIARNNLTVDEAVVIEKLREQDKSVMT